MEAREDQYLLSGFTFEDLRITANNNGFEENIVDNMSMKNVQVDIRQEGGTEAFGTAVYGS